MRAPCRQATCIAAQLDFPSVANLDSDRVQPGPGRFVLVPGSATDEVDGRVVVEAAGPPGVLRTVQFARGETDEGLDVAQPIVVEGVLVVIRHPARREFPAVVELQVNISRDPAATPREGTGKREDRGGRPQWRSALPRAGLQSRPARMP